MVRDGFSYLLNFRRNIIWSKAAIVVVLVGLSLLLFGAVVFDSSSSRTKYDDGADSSLQSFVHIPSVMEAIKDGARMRSVSTYPKNILPSPFYLHYVRFKPDNGAVNLRFTDYLSVMSGVQYLKPDGILVHGDFEPQGPYWDKLKSQNLTRHVFRKKTTNAGYRQGKPKIVAFMEHAADIAKLDILLEYGGVAVDFDVFFVHGERIKDILTTKKIITCYGDEDGYNIGFIAAHRDSKLLYAWRRSYQDIYVPDWNFNQGFVSKYLSILFRDEVYVAGKICNNPHPDRNLGSYFHNYGVLNWNNSIAIHSYERFGGVPIITPDDLNGTLTTHKELLRTIYRNLTLAPVDPNFHDEMDPLIASLPSL